MHRWGDNGKYEGIDEDTLMRTPDSWSICRIWEPMRWECDDGPFPTTHRVPMSDWVDKGEGLSKASYGFASREA